MLDLGTLPDLLRLITVPVFVVLAYIDYKTRRIPKLVWIPLILYGMIIYVIESIEIAEFGGIALQLYIFQVGISFGIVAPLSYILYKFKLFGKADFKALVTLAIIFPTSVSYYLPQFDAHLPILVSEMPLSMAIFANTSIIVLSFPLYLALKNTINGKVRRHIFVGKEVEVSDIDAHHGRILDVGKQIPKSGLDIDTLRIYLQWRGITLEELIEDPEKYRKVNSLPEKPNPTGSGAIKSNKHISFTGDITYEENDEWGARAFTESIANLYGTTENSLRKGLENLVNNDTVWISPGTPFLVPLTIGILSAIIIGDVLTTLIQIIGLA